MRGRFNLKKRFFIKRSLFLFAGLFGLFDSRNIFSAQKNLKIGLMLPYSGTYALLGKSIEDGFKLAIKKYKKETSNVKFQFYSLDDESNPAKSTDNTIRLIKKSKVDILIGTVHSGVLMGMIKIVKDSDTLLIIPNAGANIATRKLCDKNIFRTSFSNWQTTQALGKVMVNNGHKKAVFITWKYSAGKEAMESFKEGFEKNGGKVLKTLYVPFPNVEFQALLAKIASIKPDAVACFFAGGGAVKFVKDYANSGLKNTIPLYGSGFLTENLLDAQGKSAENVLTTLHYSDSLENKVNQKFRKSFFNEYGIEADVYAVQGYDAGLLLIHSLKKLNGNFKDIKSIAEAMESAVIRSPRGDWQMSKSHNPIQNIYLRNVVAGQNKVLGIAAHNLEDPSQDCKI